MEAICLAAMHGYHFAMCFSAYVVQEYDKYVREFGAHISIRDFVRFYLKRAANPKIKTPRAMDAEFDHPNSADEIQIKTLIDDFCNQEAMRLEQELFKQRKRLADAERALLTKTTKAATESQRIATFKIEWALSKLSDLRRTDLKERDFRIYPGNYVPVIVMEDGQRVIKPMRYLCRPAGKPATYDTQYPGIYNARRDNLEGFWRNQFGHTHGLMVINAFYEHVIRKVGDAMENIVLEFKPRPTQDMLVACIWSHWTGPGESDLLSFAAITDEPPAEVAAAGHNRCVIPIKPENIDAWLNPNPKDLKALYAILDDRERPYYEHRLAA